MTTPLAAVILAGGASRRMGRDKATLSFSGPSGETTFVEHTVARGESMSVAAVAVPVSVIGWSSSNSAAKE